MEHAPSMLAQGRNRPLEEWLVSLPKDLIENDPWLLYWMGACYQLFDPSLARDYFEKAFERFKTEGNGAGMFLAWSGVVSSISVGFENFKPLDHWISVLDELMDVFKEFPSKEIGLQVSSSMFSALMLRQPQHPMIEEWAERALSLAEGCSAISAQILTLSRLVNYRTYMGDFQKAVLAMTSLQQLALSRNAAPLSLITAEHGEAAYYRSTGKHKKCLKAVSAGLELSRTTGIHVYENFLLGQGVSNAPNTNDLGTAEKLLEKMGLSSSRLRPWDACFYHHLRTREALLRGDLKQAALHTELALKFCTDVGTLFSLVWCNLTKAHAMHAQGKHREATEHLAHSLGIAQ